MSDTHQHITHGSKGFHLSFGTYTLSVQYGKVNYCQRRSGSMSPEPEPEKIRSKDCEIAILDNATGAFVSLGSDTVLGWIPVGKLPAIMAAVQAEDIEGAIKASGAFDRP